MMSVTLNPKIIQRNPGFYILEGLDFGIDVQLWWIKGLSLELYITHQLELILVNMRIDNLVVGHPRSHTGNLRHYGQ